MAIEQNTKLFFKYGTQAKYTALNAKDAGTFYVTSDTHRLYLGSDLLSQAVLVVENQKDLPSGEGIDVGQIAYVSADNILCIKKKEPGWTQLNADTFVTSMTQTASTDESKPNEATIITDLKWNRTLEQKAPSASITLKGSAETGVNVTTDNGAIVISNANLAVQKDEATDGVKLGLGTANNVTFKGAGATTVDFSDSAITITSTDKDTKVTGASLTAANAETGFTFDGKIVPSEGAAITYSTSINPQIVVGGKGSKTDPKSFENGIATLDVYTTAQVDAAIKTAEQAMNAMTYKGKVSKANPLPSGENKVSIGDSYIVEESGFQINGTGTAYPVGTLIIAKAASGITENAGGFLPANGIAWDAVLASDTDTTYKFAADSESTKVLLAASAGKSSGLTFATGGSPLTASVNASATDTNEVTVSIAHDKKTANHATADAVTQTTGANAALSYVSDVTFDDYGHVNTITKGSATLVDTKLSTLSFTGSVDGKNALLTLTAKDNNGGTLAPQLTFKSTTLSISATTDVNKKDAVVTADIVWGTF